MICKACKREHNPMLTCSRAARLAGVVATGKPVVATPETMVATAGVATKHGKYKDLEARRARMREHMRLKRAMV